MSDHFRLRTGKRARVLTSQKVDTHVRVIHAIALFAVFSATFAFGIFLFRYPDIFIKPTSTPTYGGRRELKETATQDKYGGWKEAKGVAKGYFSIQTTNGKDTFVTPNGNAFFMMAVNKMHDAFIDDKAFKEKYNSSATNFAIDAANFIHSVGFNTVGNQSNHRALRNRKVLALPYVVQLEFLKPESAIRTEPEDYPDPWSTEYQEFAQSVVSNAERTYKDDPYLVAFEPTNEANFNLRQWDGASNPKARWWKFLIAADGETPAKQHWVELMEDRYDSDIEELNNVYDSDLEDFDDLYTIELGLFGKCEIIEEGEEDDCNRQYADVADYEYDIAGQFHKVNYELLKEVFPNTIVTGDRQVQGIYEEDYYNDVKPYIDVVAQNWYHTVEQGAPPASEIDEITSLAEAPLLITEHSYLEEPCNSDDNGGVYPGTPAGDQGARATAHFDYRNPILEHPKVLGLGWHQLDDPSSDNACGYTNFGLRSYQAEPYEVMIQKGVETWKSYNELRWDIEPTPLVSRGFNSPVNPVSGGVQGGFRPTTNTTSGLKLPNATGTAVIEIPTRPQLQAFFAAVGEF